jgi:hypothetical protein
MEQSPHSESVAPYLVKKLPVFYRTHISVTVFTKFAIVLVLSQINPAEAVRYYSLRSRVTTH